MPSNGLFKANDDDDDDDVDVENMVMNIKLTNRPL